MQERLTGRNYRAEYRTNYKYEKIPGRFVYEDYDRRILKVYNLNSMNLGYLRQIAVDPGLKEVTVDYTRKPMVGLESKPRWINRLLRKPVKGLSYALKLFPFKGRLLSPYIILTARK